MVDATKDYQTTLAEVLNESVVKDVQGDHLIYLSSGVVLETVDVSPMLALDVSNRFKMPPVPIIHDEEKGYDIPNPNDEDYLTRCEEVKMEQGNAILDVLIAKGTRLYSAPEDMSRPEQDNWIEDMEFLLKYAIDRRPLSRYLAWVRYIACVSQDDITKLTLKVYAKLGVSEEKLRDSF